MLYIVTIDAVMLNDIMLSVGALYYKMLKQKIKRKTFNFTQHKVESFSFYFMFTLLVIWHLNTQHNDIQHNGIYQTYLLKFYARLNTP